MVGTVPASVMNYTFLITCNDDRMETVVRLQRKLRAVLHKQRERCAGSENIAIAQRALYELGVLTVATQEHIFDADAIITHARETLSDAIRDVHPSTSGVGRRDFVLGAGMSVKITQSVIECSGIAVDSILCNTGDTSVHVCALRFGNSIIPLDVVLPPSNGWIGRGASMQVRFCERDESSDLPHKLTQQVQWLLR